MIYSRKLLFCLTVLLTLTAWGSPAYGHSVKKKKLDPIVGSYAVNVSIGAYAIWMFHEDGTVVFADSLSIEQPLPPLAPAGLYETIAIGSWKKVNKGSYEFVQSNVINLKDITTRDASGDLLLAGIPFARAKGVGPIQLSSDGKCFTGASTINFYAIDDISLTVPATIDGQPLPSISATFIGQRIGF